MENSIFFFFSVTLKDGFFLEVSFALMCIIDLTYLCYLIDVIFSLQFFSAIYRLSMKY